MNYRENKKMYNDKCELYTNHSTNRMCNILTWFTKLWSWSYCNDIASIYSRLFDTCFRYMSWLVIKYLIELWSCDYIVYYGIMMFAFWFGFTLLVGNGQFFAQLTHIAICNSLKLWLNLEWTMWILVVW